MIKICVDDGHGDLTEGKRTPVYPDGHVVRENQFNKMAAKYFAEEMKRCGCEIVFSAPGDNDVPLDQRTKVANESHATLFISFHYNAYKTEWECCLGGVETYHYPGSINGERLAKCVHNELIKGTPQVNRGVKEAGFYVLKYTDMPAILIEAGFMDVRKEADLMLSENFQKEVARETAIGVCKYLGINYVPYVEPVKPAEPPKDNNKYGIVTASVLNVRSGRGTSNSIIGKLQKDTKVKLCYLMNNWWSIDYGVNVGYVSADYIKQI